MRLAVAFAAILAVLPAAANAKVPVPPPVATVVASRLQVGGGELALALSQDWSHPLPAVRRVVIIVHGYTRNAADYQRWIAALAPADTLVAAPQFLAPEDIAAHRLPPGVLNWRRDRWSSGYAAEGPAPVSSFTALDALLAALGSRAILPNLSHVVLAGFSAGGQLVQRYATVGRGEAALGRSGVALRYVVGSPSSYLYFGDERPGADGVMAPFAGAAACPRYDRWKYGLVGDLPRYVAALNTDAAALERRYIGRDLVYMVGADDTNPNHRFLDKSCAAEAQGPTRRDRMKYFLAAMQRRAAGAGHQVMRVIGGAAHNAAKVLGSPCGRAALFDESGCPGGL
ncbi:MAG: hypothetical protein ACREFB_19150 [Stellaceae bacterium]